MTELFHMIYKWTRMVVFYGNKQYVNTKDGCFVVVRQINKLFIYILYVLCCQVLNRNCVSNNSTLPTNDVEKNLFSMDL